MIKTKDSKANIKHFIKQQTLHTRNMDKDTYKESISSNANVQATNSISKKAKQTLLNRAIVQQSSSKKKEMNGNSRNKIHCQIVMRFILKKYPIFQKQNKLW